MTQLFGRRARIVAGTKALIIGAADGGLRVTFDIDRSLKPEPNKAEVRIWNLAEASRKELEQSTDIPIQIEAGYSDTSLIFLGNLRRAFSETEGQDIVTTITTGDGEKGYRGSRIQSAFPKGTDIRSAILIFAAALGIPTGNLTSLTYQFINGGTQFSNGAHFHGNAAFELTRLLQACGKEWSIQNGVVQVLDRDKALQAKAISLTVNSGMIGSPSVNSKGELKVTSLLIPDVEPGRLLVIKSRHNEGTYRIEKCGYSGDTHGGDWIINIEGKRL